jgi:uncharacterized protein YjhX (UPF0386 family)
MLQLCGKEIRMARSKIDGVIEAVRYTSDDKISIVRMYTRHGAAWSDHVLIDRVELFKQLKNGKRLLTGTRKPALGNVFVTTSEIRLINEHIITEGQTAVRDLLAGVPVF